MDPSVLTATAAAVIGDTSIMGGRGGYFGTIIVGVAAAFARVTGES